MRGGLAAALALAAIGTAASAQSGQITNPQNTVAASIARLRGLDTMDGETQDLDLRVGETARFGNLEVTVESCRVPEADPESDAYAFLRIRDLREESPRFSGWMLASSPALSALDHPRYDVWVLSCSTR
jgi:hypothetical protein